MQNKASSSEEIYRKLAAMDKQSIAELLSRNRAESGLRDYFGDLPSELIQSTYTGLSQQQTFLQALTYLDLCKKRAETQLRPFNRNIGNLVLDFGCGWGRITQLLSLFFKPNHIVGCDVQDQAIAEVKKNGVQAAFLKVEPWPPIAFRDESVDFIFSYSVFSHLSEDNSYSWIREFHRILRPGGMAFLTTRPKDFFDYLENLRKQQEIPGFASGASRAFKDLETAKKDYEAGRFCFDPMGGGGKGLTAVYGEAFIPPAYVADKYGKIFSAVGMEKTVPSGLLNQSTIWLQK